MQRIGRYDVVRPLGRGAMGAVYEVRGPAGERLALKLLAVSGAEAIERFRREARVLEFVGRHANVVKLRDVGEHQGRPFLVMDLLEGGTLEDRLKKGPLPVREAAALLVGIARGLHFAHEAGVVHRDVKPSNVLLDARGQAFITDFGIAKDREARSLTETGAMIGTLAYMSPEQASPGDRPIDRRADVYALGAILYEVLTGERPFGGAEISLVKKILMDAPRPPRSVKPGCDPRLEAICLEALSKDPGRRQPTAEAFARELESFISGGPLAARPGVSRRAVVAAVLALAASAAGNVALATARSTALRERDAAQAEAARAAELARAPLEDAAAPAPPILTSRDAAKAALDEAERLASGHPDSAASLVQEAFELDPQAVVARPASIALLRKASRQALAAESEREERTRDPARIAIARRRLHLARLLDPELVWAAEANLIFSLARSTRSEVRAAARPWQLLPGDAVGATELLGRPFDEGRTGFEAGTLPREWLRIRSFIDRTCAGNDSRKLAFWAESLLLHPRSSFIWSSCGLFANGCGHPAEAVLYARRARALAPTEDDAAGFLGFEAGAEVVRGHGEAALGLAEQKLARLPGDAGGIWARSYAFALMGTPERARATLEVPDKENGWGRQNPDYWYIRALGAEAEKQPALVDVYLKNADQMIGP
jgi:tetratricopeptide (TPR) repeat protein